jgi:hypothetical protein
MHAKTTMLELEICTRWQREVNIRTYLLISALILISKETKGRSSGDTPFTLKPKQVALKKQFLIPKKYFPN